ncbi:MAG: NAD(+)/NADH kinase [Muribaculaceae bacterium]|nr:NAD(+)/NADH kinase [Muribaculaceae bacterium]
MSDLKFAVYGSRRQNDNVDNLRRLIISLAIEGAQVAVHEKLYDYLTCDMQLLLPGVERVVNFPDDATMAISVGGDGTFLRTVAWKNNHGAPILGVNTGHLGFLTAINLDEAIKDIDKILACDFRRDHATMLQVVAPDLKGSHFALNEVVVAKEDSSSMISVHASLNDRSIATYRADGLVVATPTGSTAYNLSVGGPIIEPAAPVWVLSPIAAHSLTLRPLVVCDNGELKLNVEGRGSRFRLVLDGRQTSLPLGTQVIIKKRKESVVILQRHDRDFTRIIGEKLLFNE